MFKLLIYLALLLPVSSQNQAPRLRYSSSSSQARVIEVRSGESFSIACNPVTPDPGGSVTIHWFHDGQALPVSNRSTTLQISNASKVDAGEYFCKVRNDYGAVLSPSTFVTIRYLRGFVLSSAQSVAIVRAQIGSWAVLKPPDLDAVSTSIDWRWFYGESAITSDFTHYESSNGELVFANVLPADFGIYRLEAHTDSGFGVAYFRLQNDEEAESSGKRNFRPDVQIVVKPRDVLVQRKSDGSEAEFAIKEASMDCVPFYKDLSHIHISWRLNGDVIPDDDVHYSVRDFSRRLIIHRPALRRSGNYSCYATANGVTVHESASLSFVESPRVTHAIPKETRVQIGDSIRFKCHFSGVPQPTIVWYFNGDDLTDALQCCSASLAMQLHPNGMLEVKSVADKHTGMYQCKARNAYGSAIDGSWLSIKTTAPTLAEPLKNRTAVDGETIVLSCPVHGSPPPLINWTHENLDIPPDEQRQVMLNGTIVISSVSTKDAGWYTCRARNTMGEVTEKLYLRVIGKPRIVKGPQNQNVVIGTNVVFHCQYSGSGRRFWYFKHQLLIPGAVRNVFFHPNGSLIIRQVGPVNIGNYTCVVESSAGKVNATGRLQISEKPGMPLRVRAVLFNDSSSAKVNLSWVEGFDGNSPVIRYAITQRLQDSRGIWSEWTVVSENVAQGQRFYVLDGLKPSGTYEFQVTAVNRYGYGVPSLPSNPVTMPQQPPAAAPRSLAGSARSSSDIIVQWMPPPADQWNGDILGYVVRYRLANYADVPWNYKNLTDTRTHNTMLSDLITWREYEIQVAAFNERGMGVYSKSVYVTTLEGVPVDAPTVANMTVLNSTAVRVSFVPPPQQLVPGVNLGYKVQLWRGPAGHGTAEVTQQVLPYSLDTVEVVISGLQEYTSYNLTVLCFTAPGDGPQSPAVEFQTKPDVPGPVSSFELKNTMFSSVDLSWTPPVNPNGDIENYLISYHPVSNSSLKNFLSVNSSVNSFKIQNLSASTDYEFDIAVKNQVGVSARKTASARTAVYPELPGPPTDLLVASPSKRSVILQFKPGYDGKTIISRWLVEALVGNSTSWTPVFNVSDPQATSIEVTGLQPFHGYVLRLTAENAIGRSFSSSPSAPFQTLQDLPEHPPVEIDVQPSSATTIRVSWMPLPVNAWNAIPNGYKLLYGLHSEDEKVTFKEVFIRSTKTSEHTLTGLCQFCLYDVKMAASNSLGDGNFSDVFSVRTYEAAPLAPPLNVAAYAVSPSSVQVSWSEVERSRRCGFVMGYQVRYRAMDSPTSKLLRIAQGSELLVLLVDLQPYTSYLVSVAAFTLAGIGPFSSPPVTVRTPEDVPSPPTQLLFSVRLSEVTMTWKPPTHPNGRVKHYSVAYWRNESGSAEDDAVKTTLASDLRMFVASGLLPSHIYRFAVAAETSAGWGPEAVANVHVIETHVVALAPSRPYHGRQHIRSATELQVAWDDFSTAREPTRFAEVRYQRDDQTENEVWTFDPERPVSSVTTVKNLRPATGYRFRVRVHNDFGYSSWSDPSEWTKTSDAEPAQPPSDVRVSAYNSSSVVVSWQAPEPSTWNSHLIGYRLLHRLYGKNDSWHIHELPMSAPGREQWKFFITDLKRFEHYAVRLQAFNQLGSSPSTDAQFVYVAYTVPATGVSGLRGETLSSTDLKITWDPWPASSEPVIGFKIYYRPADSAEEMKQDVVEGEATSVVVRELRKFTSYHVTVVPFNRAGDGVQASVDIVTGTDVPGPVGHLTFQDISIDSVNISWAEPVHPNGRILGYRVTYKTCRFENDFIMQKQEKVVGRTYLVVTNLDENVTTVFSVEAETSAGFGPPIVANVTIGPQPGSPEAPDKPAVVPAPMSLILKWQNNDDGSAPVDQYIIQYFLRAANDEELRLLKSPPSSSSPITKQATVALLGADNDAPVSWQTLTTVRQRHAGYSVGYSQLKQRSVYRFRVIARNAFGVSYPSEPSEEFVVPEGIDGSPFYLQWWFLVVLALVALLVTASLVVVLWLTGRKGSDGCRRNSVASLQLSDGGVVTYHLQPAFAKRTSAPLSRFAAGNVYSRCSNPGIVFPDDDTLMAGAGDDSSGLLATNHRMLASPNYYDSLTNGGAGTMNAVLSSTQLSGELVSEEKGRDGQQAAMNSIVKHYETTDGAYLETWRRAKCEAFRPSSPSMLSAASAARSPGGEMRSDNRRGNVGLTSFV